MFTIESILKRYYLEKAAAAYIRRAGWQYSSVGGEEALQCQQFASSWPDGGHTGIHFIKIHWCVHFVLPYFLYFWDSDNPSQKEKMLEKNLIWAMVPAACHLESVVTSVLPIITWKYGTSSRIMLNKLSHHSENFKY